MDTDQSLTPAWRRGFAATLARLFCLLTSLVEAQRVDSSVRFTPLDVSVTPLHESLLLYTALCDPGAICIDVRQCGGATTTASRSIVC